MYLVIENDEAIGFSTERLSEHDIEVPDWQNDMYAFVKVDDVWVYDLSNKAAKDARLERDLKLARTDWTQLPDVSDQIKLKYADYRQALRDITTQAGFPNEINWPIEP